MLRMATRIYRQKDPQKIHLGWLYVSKAKIRVPARLTRAAASASAILHNARIRRGNLRIGAGPRYRVTFRQIEP